MSESVKINDAKIVESVSFDIANIPSGYYFLNYKLIDPAGKVYVSDKEEYSIFDNEDDGYVLARQLKELLKEDTELFVDVCGIAGDVCVLETLKGLCQIMSNDHISVLTEFTASIDGGEKLNSFIEENNLGFIIDSSLNLNTYAIH